MPNKTTDDAFFRVQLARTGSLVRPTPEYLEALHRYVLGWADSLGTEITKQQRREQTNDETSE